MMTDTPKAKSPKRRKSVVDVGATPAKKSKGNDNQVKTPAVPKTPGSQKKNKNKLAAAGAGAENQTPKNTPGKKNNQLKNKKKKGQTPNGTKGPVLATNKTENPGINNKKKAKPTDEQVKTATATSEKNKKRKADILSAVHALEAGNMEALGDTYTLESLDEKIAAIEARDQIGKRGHRRIRFFKKIRALLSGDAPAKETVETKKTKKVKKTKEQKKPVVAESSD